MIATTWPTKDSVAFVTLAGFLQHRLDHPEDPVALALRHTRTWLRTATRDDLTTWLSEVARQAQIPEELVELPGQWWSEHPEPVPFADPQDWAPYAAIGP